MKDATPNAGFTLVELMVTLAVAVILMTAAVPTYQSVVLNNRVAKSSNEFGGFLRLARAEALKRRATVTVEPGLSGGGGASGWCAGARAVSGGATVAVFGGCGGGLVLDGGSVTSLVFTSRGLLVSVPARNEFALYQGAPTGQPAERHFTINAVGELARDCPANASDSNDPRCQG